jgi:hypothetical protein
MKRIKYIVVIAIKIIIITLFLPGCEKETDYVKNPFTESDSSVVGEITRTYSGEGMLIKVETDNGTFYNITPEDTMGIIDDSPDFGCAGIKSYTPYQSKKDIYYIRNFNYEGKAKLLLEHCYVMLGYTKVGYFEAVIMPVKEHEFSYLDTTSGRSMVHELRGNVDYVYLRFDPYLTETFFDSLYHISTYESLNDETIEEIYQKALSVQNEFRFVIGRCNEFLMLERNIFDILIELTEPAAIYEEYTIPDYDFHFILVRTEDGGLRDGTFDYYFNKVEQEPLIAYYSNISVIKDNPEEWISYRYDAFDSICKYFKMEWEYGEITFFIFNDDNEASKYAIGPLGFAVPAENQIYTRYNQTYGHELTHVISYHINNGLRIESILINEGLATWLSMRGDKCNYHRIAKEYMLTDKLDKCNLLNDGFRSCDIGYFIGASFVGFLIEQYGIDTFKTFFAQETYSETQSFQEYYKKTYEELYEEWKLYLNNHEFGALTEYETDILNTWG